MTITIDKIEPKAKGDGTIFKYIINGKYHVGIERWTEWGLKQGLTGTITTQDKSREYNGKTYTDTFITSWTTGTTGNGSSTGNGNGYTPDPTRERSIVAQVILKEAVAACIAESGGKKEIDPNRVRELCHDFVAGYFAAYLALEHPPKQPPAMQTNGDHDPFEDE